MNAKADLTCLFFPDLYPWERAAFEPLLMTISPVRKICTVDVSDRARVESDSPVTWVVSRNWRRAVDRVRTYDKKQRIVASVLGLQLEKRALPALLWSRLNPRRERQVNLLTHSPINFRFYCEIEGMESARVSYLPLPFAEPVACPSYTRPVGEISVGVFGAFIPETNLNYFLSVAHYVLKKKPQIKFRMLGAGPLHQHVIQSARDLGIGDSVIVTETLAADDLKNVDIQIYAPVRNDHFIPLFLGAAHGLPVLAAQVPGITSYIQDGKNGFIIPTNDTKPMGELIIRLAENNGLRKFVGQELKNALQVQYSAPALIADYEKLFFSTTRHAVISTLKAA